MCDEHFDYPARIRARQDNLWHDVFVRVSAETNALEILQPDTSTTSQVFCNNTHELQIESRVYEQASRVDQPELKAFVVATTPTTLSTPRSSQTLEGGSEDIHVTPWETQRQRISVLTQELQQSAQSLYVYPSNLGDCDSSTKQEIFNHLGILMGILSECHQSLHAISETLDSQP